VIQFLFALAAFIFVGYKVYSELIKDYVGWNDKLPKKRSGTDMEVSGYLQQIKFYRDLSSPDKQKFVERVQYICNNKGFQGMEGLVMTDEIRTIVAASVVQIAFRLDKWKFPSYHTFRVYPESFYSGIFRKYLKGGAGNQGYIWFSLQHYREGYAEPENGINLGLHEMAHALIIEMENGNMPHEFVSAFSAIEKLAQDRIPKIKSGQFTFLRNYAATNKMEFIAVCTEYFFERADEFRREDRELYEAFMWLYKQEPHTPPSIRQITNLPPQKKIEKNCRYARWHWSLTVALLGIFISPVLLIWQMHNVMLKGDALLLLCAGILVVSAFLLYKPIVKSSALNLTQFILIHIFGVGPFVLSLFFLLNNNIPVWQEGEAHKINKIYWETNYKAHVNFTDNTYSDDWEHRVIEVRNPRSIKEGDYVIVVTQYGPFGVPVYGINIAFESLLHDQ
jgi:MtfA peptidase